MMDKFDLISDLHADFWLGKPKKGSLTKIDAFVEGILPPEPSEALVIAGDLGHYNEQNFNVLSALKRHYAHILITPGNHDYYLVDGHERFKHRNSKRRWSHMKAIAAPLEGIHFLEGTCVELGGVTFGGTGMWYDFAYGVQVLGKRLTYMENYWALRMNDSRLTIGMPRRTLVMFEEEKKKLDAVIDQADVIVTHVSPDWIGAPPEHPKDPLNGCYYFDGSPYMDRIDGKIWCCGHIHARLAYEHRGCRFVSNALGYPDEDGEGPFKGRIVGVPLDRQG